MLCLRIVKVESVSLLFSPFSPVITSYASRATNNWIRCSRRITSSRACSSAWLERIPDKDEAGGSSPPRPTSSFWFQESCFFVACRHGEKEETQTSKQESKSGGLAQLVERLLCKQEVSGSNPLSSTSDRGKNNLTCKDLSCKDLE